MLHENAKDIICWLNAICSECEWHVVTYILDDSLLSNRLTSGEQRATFFVRTSNPPESMVNVCVCGLIAVVCFFVKQNFSPDDKFSNIFVVCSSHMFTFYIDFSVSITLSPALSCLLCLYDVVFLHDREKIQRGAHLIKTHVI